MSRCRFVRSYHYGCEAGADTADVVVCGKEIVVAEKQLATAASMEDDALQKVGVDTGAEAVVQVANGVAEIVEQEAKVLDAAIVGLAATEGTASMRAEQLTMTRPQ